MSDVERLERAVQLIAYIVVEHGDAYAPLLDRLEAELENARRPSAAQERARAILARQTRSGGLNAILPRISALCSSDGPTP